MRYILPFIVLLASCTSNKSAQEVFTPANLKNFTITVNPVKDTIFQTPKGAAIKIAKGTFDAEVTLEIKEAYTMKDILLAGLTTESDGKPLASGGMIYINTQDQKEVKLNKPISIAIPTDNMQKEMQLYKGKTKVDGTVNWVDPEPLTSSPQMAAVDTGKLLFEQSCGSCHAIDKNLTGPALAGLLDRGPWKDRQKLYDWIRNPAAFMAHNQYTQCLKLQYGVIMQAYPQLGEHAIDQIVQYIKNEEVKLPPELIASFSSVKEACRVCADTIFYDDDIIPAVPLDIMALSEEGTDPEKLEKVLRKGFTDPHISDGAYQFKVKTLGWFNVDAEVRGLPNTTLCDLSVQLEGADANAPMIVYVFFPMRKDLTVGVEKDGIYKFEKYQGKIPLFLGVEGFVLAFGNYREQFYYGTTRFKVQQQQHLNVTVKPSTREELLNVVETEKLEGINLDIIKRKMQINHYICDTINDTTKVL
jgi:mono/diheme cytochrome c family protein